MRFSFDIKTIFGVLFCSFAGTVSAQDGVILMDPLGPSQELGEGVLAPGAELSVGGTSLQIESDKGANMIRPRDFELIDVTPSVDPNVQAMERLRQRMDQGGTVERQIIDDAIGEVLRAQAQTPAETSTLAEAIDLLPQGAEAQLRQGMIRYYFDNDPVAALPDLVQAAEAGNEVGAALAGRALVFGTPNRDVDQGIAYLNEAANSASDPAVRAAASLDLATVYRQGLVVERDLNAANDLLYKASFDEPAVRPVYVDFLARDLGAPSNDPRIAEIMSLAGSEGNASALYWQFERGTADQQADLLDQLRGLDAPLDQRFLGDAELSTGNVQDAFEAYSNASPFDPYALAQTGILALDNPDLALLDNDQALANINGAASLGEPSALARVIALTDDPNAQEDLALLGLENDPDGQYAEEFEGILNGRCPVGAEECLATPIWYMTNRQFNEDTGEYGTGFSEGLTVGMTTTVVRVETTGDPQTVSNARRLYCEIVGDDCRPDANLTVTDPEVQPEGNAADAYMQTLHSVAEGFGVDEVVLYLHGFNTKFDSSSLRFAKLMNRTGVQAVPVMLSWPSAGRTIFTTRDVALFELAYLNDQKAAERSCGDIRLGMDAAIDAFGAENVHLLAHSMGNYLLQLILDGCGDPAQAMPASSFKSVVMAAPDVEMATFKDWLDARRTTTEHLTLYVTANDLALNISKSVNGGRRLGQGGVDRFVDDRSITVDSSFLEDTGGDTFIRHGHVFDLYEAQFDLGLLLQGFYAPRVPRQVDPIAGVSTAFYLTNTN